MSPFLRLLIAALRAGIPLPSWTDAEAIRQWICALAGPIAEFIAELAQHTQLKVTGVPLLTAGDLELAQQQTGVDMDRIKKIVNLLITLLPIILPLVLDDGEKPVDPPRDENSVPLT
ncbi:MAG: hypothetical protein ACOY3P_14350 [Planctomycetota bacterium]